MSHIFIGGKKVNATKKLMHLELWIIPKLCHTLYWWQSEIFDASCSWKKGILKGIHIAMLGIYHIPFFFSSYSTLFFMKTYTRKTQKVIIETIPMEFIDSMACNRYNFSVFIYRPFLYFHIYFTWFGYFPRFLGYPSHTFETPCTYQIYQ